MTISITALKQQDVSLVVVTDYVSSSELKYVATNFSLTTGKILCIIDRADISDITTQALVSAMKLFTGKNDHISNVKIAYVFEKHVSNNVPLSYLKTISIHKNTLVYKAFCSVARAAAWLGTSYCALEDSLVLLCPNRTRVSMLRTA